jgi:hypothetical protein
MSFLIVVMAFSMSAFSVILHPIVLGLATEKEKNIKISCVDKIIEYFI